MRVLALSGSLRRDSHNTGLLRAAQELAGAGVEIAVFEGLREIPPYDEDAEPAAPGAVAALREAIAGADALLVATPEYNGSVPGVLKNAIDWASRPRATTPLHDKPAAIVGASTGAFGAAWAQADLRRVLGITGARVVGEELHVGRAQDRFVAGELADPEIRAALAGVLGTLEAAVAERERVRAAA